MENVMLRAQAPSFTTFNDYRATVIIVVAVRWFLILCTISVVHYRIEHGTPWVIHNTFLVGIAVLNGYLTWRLVTHRAITWAHALLPSLIDIAMITGALWVFEGFQNSYFVFYYPALLGLAVMFPGRVGFAVSGAVMALYTLMAFSISPTLDIDLKEEKVLFNRLATMLGMVVAGTLIAGWERSGRREAVAAERQRSEENLELQRIAQEAELAAVEERGRIAREIHDGIAQSIYMLSLNLETCVEVAGAQQDGLGEQLQASVALSKSTLMEVRHYIFDLKPYLEGDKGVGSMVENQVREFNMVTGVPVAFETRGEERQVPVSAATCLYRVTQEALANIFKHARASNVTAMVEFGPGGVQLMVGDNGAGFDLTTSNGGHGLNNMRHRAEEMGGTFSLDSRPGNGTQIVVNLPY